MSDAPLTDAEIAEKLATEAKRRVRSSIKAYHNADQHWFTQNIYEYDQSKPFTTYIAWIDEGIDDLLAELRRLREREKVLREECRAWREADTDRGMLDDVADDSPWGYGIALHVREAIRATDAARALSPTPKPQEK